MKRPWFLSLLAKARQALLRHSIYFLCFSFFSRLFVITKRPQPNYVQWIYHRIMRSYMKTGHAKGWRLLQHSLPFVSNSPTHADSLKNLATNKPYDLSVRTVEIPLGSWMHIFKRSFNNDAMVLAWALDVYFERMAVSIRANKTLHCNLKVFEVMTRPPSILRWKN